MSEWLTKDSTITMIGGIYPKKLEEYLLALESRIAELEKRPSINIEDGLVCAKCYERIGE